MVLPELMTKTVPEPNTSWTWTMVKFIVMTLVFLIALIMMVTVGNLNEISKNFPKYRCNPILMPFAGSFGYDAKENFDFCLTNIFNGKAAQIFAPIYGILGSFTDVVKQITNVALGLRQLFANFLFGVNNFIPRLERIARALAGAPERLPQPLRYSYTYVLRRRDAALSATTLKGWSDLATRSLNHQH